VRGVIVRGITLACTLRRPAASQTSHHPTAAQQPEAPASRRLRAPHRPPSTSPAPRAWAAKQTKAPAKRASEGAAPLPPPWLAHLLAARHHRRPACLNRGDIHFTPQAFPQLSAKACAVLNTPLKDCDPKTLKLLVSTFTQHINQIMSPEAGIADPAAAFPNLLHRLNAALADANADASLSTTPQSGPATPADAVPDAPDPQLPATGPTMPSAKATPPLSPRPLSGPPASAPSTHGAITAPAPATTPHTATASAPVVHASRRLSTTGESFRYHTQSFARRRRSALRCRRPLFPRSLRHGPQYPPPWRLYYAACTGPP